MVVLFRLHLHVRPPKKLEIVNKKSPLVLEWPFLPKKFILSWPTAGQLSDDIDDDNDDDDDCFIIHYSGNKQSRISVDYERRMFSALWPYLGSVTVLNNKYM